MGQMYSGKLSELSLRELETELMIQMGFCAECKARKRVSACIFRYCDDDLCQACIVSHYTMHQIANDLLIGGAMTTNKIHDYLSLDMEWGRRWRHANAKG